MALDRTGKSAHSFTHSFFLHKYLSNFYLVRGTVQDTVNIKMKKSCTSSCLSSLRFV